MSKKIPGPYETTLTATDRTGSTVTIKVRWRPLDYTWTDPGFENVGETLWEFDSPDNPPCYLVEDPGTNSIILEEAIVRNNGQIDCPTRVPATRKRLCRGEYSVEVLEGVL